MSTEHQQLTTNRTANDLLTTYQSALDLPSETIERSADIINDALDNGLGNSRCHYTLTAGATLLAIQEHDVPRVADDLAPHTNRDSTDITAQDINQEARTLKSELNIHTLPTDPQAYLEYYISELDVDDATADQAHNLLETAHQLRLTQNGTSPTSIAAACIDTARRLTGDDIHQHEISDVSHVSGPQIRKHAQSLSPH